MDEYIWDFHRFDAYPDGSFVEKWGLGYHTQGWKISKGNWISEMHEEIFMFGFVLRPVEIITFTRR